MGNVCAQRKQVSVKETPRTVPDTTRHSETVELYHFAPLADNYSSIQNRFRPSQATTNRAQGLSVLKSVNNTSFINCIIQCLSNTQPFVDYFISGISEKEFDIDSETNCLITKEFGNILSSIWLKNENPVNTAAFLEAIRSINTDFNIQTENDAHEFLIFLFDQFHNDLYRKASGLPGELEFSGDPIEIEAAKSWQDSLLSNSSIIADLFQGQLRFKAQCKNCGKYTYHFDSYICLRFPVRNHMKTLYECIQDFIDSSFAQQEMYCNHCTQTAVTSRKVEIWKLPPVLIINLKRIDEEPGPVLDYPVYGLDMSKLVSGPFKHPPKYELFAFVKQPIHQNGKYSSVCRNRMNDHWYEFEENRLMNFPEEKLKNDLAYTLFYYNTSMTEFPRQFYNKPETWPHAISTVLNISPDFKPKELENKPFFMDPYLIPNISMPSMKGSIPEMEEEDYEDSKVIVPAVQNLHTLGSMKPALPRDSQISRAGSFEFQAPPSHFFMHKLTHKGDISTPRVYLR